MLNFIFKEDPLLIGKLVKRQYQLPFWLGLGGTYNPNNNTFISNGQLLIQNAFNSAFLSNSSLNGSPVKTSLRNQALGSAVDAIGGQLSNLVTNEMFGDSEVGRNVGLVIGSGLGSGINTFSQNLISGKTLLDGIGMDAGSAGAGALAGIAANYIGKGITSLGGNSMLSRGLGAASASALGSLGGLYAGKLFSTSKNGANAAKVAAGASKFAKAANIGGLAAGAIGTGLEAAFGPSKEYQGKYGGITLGMDTVYDLIQAGVGFAGPVGSIVSGAMALNKGLSNIFGSTSGMTTQDAILGSAFVGAPVKWLNMAGAKTTDKFGRLSWQNTEKTNAFMGNSFGDLADVFEKAREEAGKTYGTFSRGAYNKALANIQKAKKAWDKILAMTDQNEYLNIRSLDMTSINNLRYALMIQGGWNPIYRGKMGMKILNNQIDHNRGMRYLSAAALIDNKQMILSNWN